MAANIAPYIVSLLANATPYIPSDGAQVIERLPSRRDPAQRELTQLRQQLAIAPNDLALAVKLAQRYIEIGRKEFDPRYLGYAQASLGPWWNMDRPPVLVLMLRATLLQNRHQFAEALADLDSLLKVDRRNPQAWLTRASVLQAQGRYEEAKASCANLYRLSSSLVTQTCMAAANSLSGQAVLSYKALLAALSSDQSQADSVKVWVIEQLAEMAWRLGDKQAAEAHYEQALSIAPADSYLLASYGDFLLDQERYAEVESLLKDKRRADPLLLRYALALKARRSPAVVAEIEALRARFEAANRRGDSVHLREQSRFELQLMNRPELALKLARENWSKQKEPADARTLLEAAIAAHEPEAARETIVWLKAASLEDYTLSRLVKTLEPVS